MKNIDSFESLILKPFSDTRILPEMFNEVFEMDNCPEHVTAHTELFLGMNTSNSPRRAVCKRQGQEWVTGTPGAGAQNGPMKISSGLAGGCVALFLTTAVRVLHRRIKRNSLPKSLRAQKPLQKPLPPIFVSVWLYYNFAQISEKYWLCLSLAPGTVTNSLCGLG